MHESQIRGTPDQSQPSGTMRGADAMKKWLAEKKQKAASKLPKKFHRSKSVDAIRQKSKLRTRSHANLADNLLDRIADSTEKRPSRRQRRKDRIAAVKEAVKSVNKSLISRQDREEMINWAL